MFSNLINFIGTILAITAYLFLTSADGAFVMAGYHWAVQLVLCLSALVVGLSVLFSNNTTFLKRYLLVLLMGVISALYYNNYEYLTTAIVVGQPIAGLAGFLVALTLGRRSDDPLVGQLMLWSMRSDRTDDKP